MNARTRLLELAEAGHRAPIGTHLVLHERDDHEAILLDGQRLGGVVMETADRFATPLAIPLMDLKIEKEAILSSLGVAAAEIEGFHFQEPPPEVGGVAATPRMEASCEALAHVANASPLLPIGMCIGPFSLMTKLVSDPITPVYLAGTGLTAEDEEDVEMVESLLAIARRVVLDYIHRQVRAGARAVIVCEPAANQVYFSPNQLAESYDIFDRYVMDALREIRERLAGWDADFILHDCGELTEGMIRRFGTLDPAMLSLGGSCVLWRDAALVPRTTVLYGNLPSKRFYSSELTTEKVEAMAADLASRMTETRHPFILGSECDVLSVAGSEDEIMAKVLAFLQMGK